MEIAKIITGSISSTLILFCFFSINIFAEDSQTKHDKSNNHKPKLGLVLEGGGALGFAHVGVLKVLEEARVPVDIITGTSMGSIVGAAYASGRTVQEMEQVLSETNWDDLFNETIPRDLINYRDKPGREGELFGSAKIGIKDGQIQTAVALVEGQKVEPLLQRLFGKTPSSVQFSKLPIPFYAVATNIENGEQVILDHGNLSSVARASMSVPGFFSPIEIDGRLLVDGGMVNNFPADIALAKGAERLIGVEFNFDPKKREELQGPLAITAQVLDLLLEKTSAKGRDLFTDKDVMIHPDVKDFSSTSFSSAKEIMKAGENEARRFLPALKKFSISEGEYAKYQTKRLGINEYRPIIEYVRIEGVPEHREKEIRESITIKLGESISREEMEKQIDAMHQTGDYKKVTYDIEEKDGKHGVVIYPQQKEWVKNYLRMGFGIEDNFDGSSNYALAFNGRFRDLNSFGAHLDTQLEIGRNPRVFTELYQPLEKGSRFFVAPEVLFGKQNFDIQSNGDIIAEYQREVATVGLKGGVSFRRYGEWDIGWYRGDGRFEKRIGDSSLSNYDYDIGEVTSRFIIDQVDNPDFPTTGYRFSTTATFAKEEAGSNKNFERYRTSGSVPFTFGRNTLLLSAEAGTTSNNLPVERSYSLGGFFDISGFQQGSLITDNYHIGRVAAYRRISEGGSSLFPFGGFVGTSLEYASLQTQIESIGDISDIIAGSVFVGFDTPFFPVYLAYGMADTSDQAVYLVVGRIGRQQRR